MKKLTLLIVAGLLILTGCSKKGSSSSTDSYRGVFSTDINTLDYTVSTKNTDSDHYANFIDGLSENDSKGNFIPATSLGEPKISDDGLEITYSIRPGVQWITSDLQVYDELKPSDYVTGMKHAVKEQSDTLYLVSDSIVGLKEYISDQSIGFDNVGIVADDEAMTLTYKLLRPEPFFNTKTTYGILFPINEAFLESKGEDFGASKPDGILYNGPFILSNNTEKTKIEYIKNPYYWDKDNVFLEKVSFDFFDQKDIDSLVRGYEDGTYTAARVFPNSAGYPSVLEKYSDSINASLTTGSTFNITFNLNRVASKNTHHTDSSKEDAHKALLNKSFRQSLMFAINKGSYLAQNVGNDMKETSIRNILTPSHFVHVGDKSYADVVKEKLVALNPELYADVDLNDGVEGVYNPEKAKKLFAQAINELGDVSLPIQIDLPAISESDLFLNQAKSLKSSIEDSLGKENIQVNIVLLSKTEYQQGSFFVETGSDSDFDMSTASGWSADFVDPSGYLEIYNPINGSNLNYLGLNPEISEVGMEAANQEVLTSQGFYDYNELLNNADNIIKDIDKRYEAYAEAEAWLFDNVLQIPLQAGGGMPSVSNITPFTKPTSFTGLGSARFKFMKIQDTIVTQEQFNKAKEEFLKG